MKERNGSRRERRRVKERGDNERKRGRGPLGFWDNLPCFVSPLNGLHNGPCMKLMGLGPSSN